MPLEQVDGSGTVLVYLHDQLGSTRGVADTSGNIAASYCYDAYGNLLSKTGTASTPLGYGGQYTDSESGLQYLRARYYDPGTMQFLTVDPLLSSTGDPYSYASGDALNGTDPTGLDCGWRSPQDCVGAVGHPLLGAKDTVVSGARTVAIVGLEGGMGFIGSEHADLTSGNPLLIGRGVINVGFLAMPDAEGLELGTRCAYDVLKNPWFLEGRSPAESERLIGDTPGWRVETLRKGSHKGQAWVLREYGRNGEETGPMIQWHPGRGHHGPNPYWKTRSSEYGISPEIPAGPDDR